MSSSVIEMQEASEIIPSQKFEGHTDWVTGTIHLPDGQRMMTCSTDGSLRVWNLKSGKQIGDDWRDGDSGVWTIALSPDGKKVVSGSEDGGMRLWDIDTGKVIAKWMGHTTKVWSVCWSRDGRRMVSGYHGIAREWDVENGETIPRPIMIGYKMVYAVVYSPDMSMFATGGYDCFSFPDSNGSPVRIWDTKTGELVANLKGHTSLVWCLAWTPDGKTLISGSYDSSIRTWDTSDWKQIAVLHGHTNGVYDIAISLNGRILASASTDKTARLWNLDNSQPISSPLKHTHIVNRVSFSANGKLLATGCNDHNAYIWDVSAVLREAGLDDLLLDQHHKSLLATDATPRPVHQPIIEPPRVPRAFLDDTPNRAHLSVQHHPKPRSLPSHRSTIRSRFMSLFRPTHPDSDAHTPSRPRPFHFVRNYLSGKSGGADIELDLPVVEVTCQTHRRPRTLIPGSAGERRGPIRENPAASSSRPPNSTIMQ